MQNILRFWLLFKGVALLLFMNVLQAQDGGVMEVAPGVYLRPGVQEEFSASNQGHIANIGFIVGSRRVAVIDTGSSYREGMALRGMIREITPLPIEYVILTHMHPDHALGAAAFSRDKPLYIGHGQLSEALARRWPTYLSRLERILGDAAEGTQMVLPSQAVAVDRSLRLDLGGRTLELRAYPTAHTNNDLTVYDESTGTLWLSDLLFVERIPVVDGSLLGWLKLIDGLGGTDCIAVHPAVAPPSAKRATGGGGECGSVKRVVPGHGPVVTQWKRALAEQRRYLELIASGIREVIAKGGTLTQAVERVGWEERDNWLLFDANHGRNVTAGFAELEWE